MTTPLSTAVSAAVLTNLAVAANARDKGQSVLQYRIGNHEGALQGPMPFAEQGFAAARCGLDE